MSGDLKWNKIFGAGLGAVLTIVLVREVADRLYAREAPEKMGYLIEVAEETGGGAAAEGPALLPDWGTVLASADLAGGEAQFKKCQSCHNIANGGANQVGPNLWNVVGAPVGKHAGYAYSEALTAHAATAPTWTYDELYAFLAAPAKHIPGTKMSFAGIRKSEDRVNLIAWMRNQASAPAAIPAPDPSRQPGAAAAAAPAEGTVPGAAPTDGTGGGNTGGAPTTGPAAAPTAQAPEDGSSGGKGQGAVTNDAGPTTTKR